MAERAGLFYASDTTSNWDLKENSFDWFLWSQLEMRKRLAGDMNGRRCSAQLTLSDLVDLRITFLSTTLEATSLHEAHHTYHHSRSTSTHHVITIAG